MKEEQINKVKEVLSEWNPLGDQAKLIPDLENYETEAIDILFLIDKKSSITDINKILNTVLSQAFGLNLNLNESKKYAEKIKTIINED